MIKRKAKTRKLTKQQEKFVSLMARGYHEGKGGGKMSIADAYEMAGYSPDAGNAYRLYQDLKEIIKETRNDLIDENQCATLAAKIIEDIMLDVEVSPQIRLKAAQDVMHRTGHDKPQEIISTSKVSEMTDAELDEQLASLIESSDNVKELKHG